MVVVVMWLQFYVKKSRRRGRDLCETSVFFLFGEKMREIVDASESKGWEGCGWRLMEMAGQERT